MTETVKEFLRDSYQIVSASSPTAPLQGSDNSIGLNIVNRLISSYSGTGLMLTVAQYVTYDITIGQSYITFGSSTYTPTPDVTIGRLANLEDAWLLLDGVTYPLVIENRNVFLASYKYDPQLGLPRFLILFPDVNLTTVRLYPGPSQAYQVNFRAKFELPTLTLDSTMAGFNAYYIRFLQIATAKELAMYKGRAQAWTPFLEAMYLDAKKDMESVSSCNLVIQTENESLLNGSWRVRAGV